MAETVATQEAENRKVIDQYMHDVRKVMDWPENAKSENLDKLFAQLQTRNLEEECLSREALCQTFGTPEEVASSFLMDHDPDEIRKRASRSAKIKRITLIAAIAIVAIIAIVYFAAFTDVAQTNRGHGESDVISQTFVSENISNSD